MWKEIGHAFKLIGSAGDGCRCVLLVGNGKAFCAGIDISDPNFGLLEASDAGVKADTARRYLSFRYKILDMQRALTEVENCAVPVVAAIHGACIGAGIDLSCCADIRICSESAQFGIRETMLGLAADVGTLQRFPKIVAGSSRARELCYTGENFPADEAAAIGFVSRVSSSEKDLLQSAMEVCTKIAGNSPVAVSGTKLSLNYSRDHSVTEGLEHIAMHNSAALMTDDLAASFMSKSHGGDETPFAHLLAHSKL